MTLTKTNATEWNWERLVVKHQRKLGLDFKTTTT